MNSSKIIGNMLHPPSQSILIQKGLYAMNEVLTGIYGANRIAHSTLLAWINELLRLRGVPKISQESLTAYIDKIAQDHPGVQKPFVVKGGDVLLQPAEITWDDGFDREGVRSLIQVQSPVLPERFRDELDHLHKRYMEMEDEKLELLITSALCSRSDILSYVSSIISGCNTYLYLMVAFYDDEVEFFTSFVAEVSKLKKLDLRIIIRDPYDAKKNRQFINDITSKLPGKDIIRIFGRPYLVEEVVNIGHLHSKMMVTENALLVGSANITNLSLKRNEESAILSNNRDLIKQATDHFLLVWDRLQPLEVSSCDGLWKNLDR